MTGPEKDPGATGARKRPGDDARKRPGDDARSEGGGPPRPSRWLVGWFRRYTRRYLARHFHAVRLSRRGGVPAPRAGENVVVYFNHPGWWDPLVAFFLAHRLFPGRDHWGPIDAAALARYRLLGRLGFFGIEPEGLAGARRFLGVSEALLARPAQALWVTPQGTFADPRQPAVLRPGLARLAERLAARPATSARPVLFVPLALEYPFWQERFPEALVRFGTPLPAAEATQEALESALAAAQEALAAEAIARDPAAFLPLVGGRAGVGGAYELWQSVTARLRGRTFVREHDPR